MKIRAIDFQALWQMIETHGNQDEWKAFESFPVPVNCWDSNNQRTYGYLILKIRLRASVRGGVCRFEVFTGETTKPISLAKYLQSNHWKYNEDKRFGTNLETVLIACDRIDNAFTSPAMKTNAYRTVTERQTKKYLNAMGRLADYRTHQ